MELKMFSKADDHFDFRKIRIFKANVWRYLTLYGRYNVWYYNVFLVCSHSFLYGVSSLSNLFDFWLEMWWYIGFVFLWIPQLGKLLLLLFISCTHPIALYFLPFSTQTSSVVHSLRLVYLCPWQHFLFLYHWLIPSFSSCLLQTLSMSFFIRIFCFFSIHFFAWPTTHNSSLINFVIPESWPPSK